LAGVAGEPLSRRLPLTDCCHKMSDVPAAPASEVNLSMPLQYYQWLLDWQDQLESYVIELESFLDDEELAVALKPKYYGEWKRELAAIEARLGRSDTIPSSPAPDPTEPGPPVA